MVSLVIEWKELSLYRIGITDAKYPEGLRPFHVREDRSHGFFMFINGKMVEPATKLL